MSLVEAYIEHIPEFSKQKLEEFSEEWVEHEDTRIKEQILPYLIEEKLRIYEKEYA